MTFYSKIDLWLVALVAVAILSPLFMVLSKSVSSSPNTIYVLIGVTVFNAALMYVLTWPCYYKLLDNELQVKCGIMINKHIAYSSIKSIEKSNNPASAPALSLKRIAIAYDGGFLLISPKDRDTFINELNNRIENL